MYVVLGLQSWSRCSGVLNSEWSHLAVSKSLVTASTRYSEVTSAAECGFVKTLWAMLGKKRNNK